MASPQQIRGVLLEEAILALLRASGYRTVVEVTDDPTLGQAGGGLTVKGRGTVHQIDAIADLRIGQPFSNPQRLLVEAKAYADHRTIGLNIVRGTVGVLKDVSEYWVPRKDQRPGAKRYRYQVAIFSSSDFSADAQDYAFAHDVYLLPLARSSYFAPVIQAIYQAMPNTGDDSPLVPSEVRAAIRQRLQPESFSESHATSRDLTTLVAPVVAATRRIGASLIAILGHAFPVFLTPREGLSLDTLQATEEVEIHFRQANGEQGWLISRAFDREPLFTFDLPPELFELYAQEGVLSRRSALDLKTAHLGAFTAIYAPQDEIRIFNFRLSPAWVDQIREQMPAAADRKGFNL